MRNGSDQEQGARGQEDKKPETNPAIIKKLMQGDQRPGDLTGPGGIMEQLTKRLYERVLGAAMTHYLGYEKGQTPRSKPIGSAGELETSSDPICHPIRRTIFLRLTPPLKP